MIKLYLRRQLARLLALAGRDHVRHGDALLPPRRLRFCGPRFKDEGRFLASARAEAERLQRFCGLGADSRILDVGCGPGRLAIGLLERHPTVAAYRGVDVDEVSIAWCRRHLATRSPAFRFVHLDLANARYNPRGRVLDASWRFPFEAESFDIIYLYSVFSHMVLDDVRAYLGEFRRLLAPAGRIFLTGFFERGVSEVSENPDGYRAEWRGSLHCVRYDWERFRALLGEHGFEVERFDYGTETDGQSGVYLGAASVAGAEISPPAEGRG